jgi:RHS repeat-associated protein
MLGSVKTATTDTGAVEDRYEYDAFGTVYQGDLSGGMNLGYTGKPYDTATGLYNYGYRDYKPQAARFTTVDPIRDGNNWFAYVNNDPVNWVDLWGLSQSDPKGSSPNEGNRSSVLYVASDIIGKIIASPMTAVGLIAGGTLNLISWLSGNDVSFEPANNAFSFNTGLMLFKGGAMTLGNVIIYAGGAIKNYHKDIPVPRYDGKKDNSNEVIRVNLGRHEEAHTLQYQALGIYTIPVLLGSSVINTVFRRSETKDFIGSSSLEKFADDYAESFNE